MSPRALPLSAVALATAGLALGAHPAAAAQPHEWRMTEQQRVGPPQFEFGSITDVAIDGAGRLWIVDGLSGELFVAQGADVKRVATEGEGPGELMPGALELVVLPGDTILVVDPQRRRLHRFAADGSYARTVTITGDDMTGGWRLLPGGRLAMRVYPRTVPRPGETSSTEGDAVRAVDLEGNVGDVLAQLPPTESFRMGAGPMPIVTLLAPQPLWDVDAQGNVLVASTHRYRVTAHGPAGNGRAVVSRDVGGGRVVRAVANAARELLREELMHRRMPPAAMEQMVSAAAVADAAPVMGGVMAGPGGTIWVQDPAKSGAELLDLERPGGPVWRVYDAAGQAVGSATFAPGVLPVEWRGDLLAAIARDDVGRTSAVVYRVARGR